MDRSLLVCFGFVLIPVVFYLAIFFVVLAPSCVTIIEKKISDLSGFDFEIDTTVCFGIGSWVDSKIMAAKKGKKRRTLLVKYGPIAQVALPTISVPEKDRIVIAIPWVSSVHAKRNRWRGMRIDYEIGKITYPGRETRLDDAE